jgi:NADH:ubiquinone oxidoreductase subunit F (NADH-binding)
LAAVAAGRRAVVVVNATEGEPASKKDKVLLAVAPHLVLDGAGLAARAIGAREVHVCVDRVSGRAGETMRRAVDERARASRGRLQMHCHDAPDRYVAGEETALVHWLNGGEARPTFVPPRPYQRGVSGRPTLVQNAETLAHIALIARHGPEWFRSVGVADDPGTALVTVAGDVPRPGVIEVANGSALTQILQRTSCSVTDVEAVLVGGYFGTWLRPDEVERAAFDRASLAAVGAAPGCGVIAPIGRASCGLLELARVTRWLASENAGQCGPCVHGLPAIAGALEELYRGDRHGGAMQQAHRWLAMVEGRGACKHPDGVARFVRSGLRAFAADVDRHRQRGPCHAAQPRLPVPATGGWR